jgi:hypothetical protein
MQVNDIDLDKICISPHIVHFDDDEIARYKILNKIISHHIQRVKAICITTDKPDMFNIPSDGNVMLIEPTTESLQLLINTQCMKIERRSLEGIENMDDIKMMYINDNKNELNGTTPVKEIAFNGRFYLISSIFSYNRYFPISPEIRINYDYIIFGDLLTNIERIYYDYFRCTTQSHSKFLKRHTHTLGLGRVICSDNRESDFRKRVKSIRID